MKLHKTLTFLLVFSSSYGMACDICEKRQPAITQGLTHGTGPDSNWDWVIISIISIITLLTLFYSVKFLIKPGEKELNHIKQSVLN